jgi:hypothetical protein
MAKPKKYYIIYKGKRQEIVRNQSTSKGIYVIPMPKIQKELGGTDLHYSYEADGKIQHMKSRKLKYEKEGTLDSFLFETVKTVTEQSSIEEIPEGMTGIIISPLKMQELLAKNSTAPEHLRVEYLNIDNFLKDLSQEEQVEKQNINSIPSEKIAFFFGDGYVIYYFKGEFKKIKHEHFSLLSSYEN